MVKCKDCDWRVTGPTGDTVLCFECGDVRGTEDVLREQQKEMKKVEDRYDIGYRAAAVEYRGLITVYVKHFNRLARENEDLRARVAELEAKHKE